MPDCAAVDVSTAPEGRWIALWHTAALDEARQQVHVDALGAWQVICRQAPVSGYCVSQLGTFCLKINARLLLILKNTSHPTAQSDSDKGQAECPNMAVFHTRLQQTLRSS